VGFLFFGVTMYWFLNIMNWFGWIALVGVTLLYFYLAIYFGLFGWLYFRFKQESLLIKMILVPSIWVLLDYLRSYLLTGFDWASLGYSQYKNLPLIQIADVTGVFGVTFIVVMLNVYLKEAICVIASLFFKAKQSLHTEIASSQKSLFAMTRPTILMAIILILWVTYGWEFVTPKAEKPSFASVSVVQGNIPQQQKWSYTFWPIILQRYQWLTEDILKDKPDLIVWPETAFPGILGEDDDMLDPLKSFMARNESDLLLGAIEKIDKNYYNAAFLMNPQGERVTTYHKMHLVPFGEFLPLRKYIKFVAKILDIGDFSRGEKTIFKYENKVSGMSGTFSVLICFEDTVSSLARDFVNNGAELLVNMTNDGWFGDTHAPLMHLQGAVFRAVENRRYMVRAANNGVSVFIDDRGKIYDWVEDQNHKRISVAGTKTSIIYFLKDKTFYTKFGDIFVIFCLGSCILGFVSRKIPHQGDLSAK
jgi:apolipoprotein N-acyltransferase